MILVLKVKINNFDLNMQMDTGSEVTKFNYSNIKMYWPLCRQPREHDNFYLKKKLTIRV